MSPALTRRDFLIAVLAAACSAPLCAVAAPANLPDVRKILFGNRSLDRENLARFTAIHLARHPAESRVETLLRKLGLNSGAADPGTLKRSLLARVRADFREQRIENVDGWILAVTEVRLWCLYLADTG